VQADERWDFIYCKEKNKGPEDADNDEIGDRYNWVALDLPAKLVLAFVCGRHTSANAMELMRQSAPRYFPRRSFPVDYRRPARLHRGWGCDADGPMRLRATGEDLTRTPVVLTQEDLSATVGITQEGATCRRKNWTYCRARLT
jgi:hypothetical protein